MRENMADQERKQTFVKSLKDWGYVFMLAVWLQSVMISAIAKKTTDSQQDELAMRNELMTKGMAHIWRKFKDSFPGDVTTPEDEDADMIMLIRNQSAHCHILSNREFALFLPNEISKKLLNRLKHAGRVRIPTDEASTPSMLIMREGDTEWFVENTELMWNFLEKTILRLTRACGIDDSAIR